MDLLGRVRTYLKDRHIDKLCTSAIRNAPKIDYIEKSNTFVAELRSIIKSVESEGCYDLIVLKHHTTPGKLPFGDTRSQKGTSTVCIQINERSSFVNGANLVSQISSLAETYYGRTYLSECDGMANLQINFGVYDAYIMSDDIEVEA